MLVRLRKNKKIHRTNIVHCRTTNIFGMAKVNFLYRSKQPHANLKFRLLYRIPIESTVIKKGVKTILPYKDFVLEAETKLLVQKSYWENRNSTKLEIRNAKVKLDKKLLELETYILEEFNKVTYPESFTKKNLQSLTDKFYNPKGEKEKMYLSYWINHIIDNAPNRENSKGGYGLSKNRIKAYKNLLVVLQDYEQYIGEQLKVSSLGVKGFEDLKKWLFNIRKYRSTTSIKKLLDYQTVVKEALKNKVQIANDFENVKFKTAKTYDNDMDVITLSLTDIEKIEKAELNKISHFNARKWLIISCFTGQRGEDLKTRIRTENFKRIGDNYAIVIKQEKGNKKVHIPVLPKVKDIFENGLPYPVSTQKLNKYFKEICEIAKINEPVMGVIREKELNRGVKKVRPKWMYIGTHTGRRTFASMHYGKLPTPLIMAVTGHKKESTFLLYCGVEDDAHLGAFNEFYKKDNSKDFKLRVEKDGTNK